MRSRNSHFKTTRFPAVLLVCAVLVAFGALAFFSCSDSGPSGPLTSEQMAEAMEDAVVAQEQYVQALAEKFAPYLWFDACVPSFEMEYSFPMDAAAYYQKRENEGYRGRIFDTSCAKVYNGEIPTYYEYSQCGGDFTVQPRTAGLVGNCVPLLAGKKIDVGTVCLERVETDSGEYLGATYELTGGWELSEVHLWVGKSLSDIPQTKKGNPKVGHFPYKAEGLNGQTTCSFYLPPVVFGETIYVAAHAEVRKETGEGDYLSESAWAAGNRMVERGNWATYFSAEQECMEEEIMYWWFYGLQPYCWGYEGRHDGDWERVAVKIVEGELTRVMYFQHGGWHTKEVSEIEICDGSCNWWAPCGGGKPGVHPVVFTGKTSHGSYPDRVGEGPVTWQCHYWRDFRNPSPYWKHMHSELNLVRLSRDAGSPEWMFYEGGWGSDQWGNSVEGPEGPFRNIPRCNMPICKGTDTHTGDGVGDNQMGCRRNLHYPPGEIF